MKKVTGQLASQLKELVLDHLQGEALEITRLRLQSLAEAQQRSARDLMESVDVVISDPFIIAIMGSLSLPEDLKESLAGDAFNLHEFLTSLADPHVAVLLKTVNRVHPARGGRVLLAGAGLAAGLGVAAHQGWFKAVRPVLSAVWESLPARVLPLTGRLKGSPLLSAVPKALRFVFAMAHTSRLSPGQRLMMVCQSALAIAGVSFWAMAGTLTLLSAGFLMASAGTAVVAAAFALAFKPKAGVATASWQSHAFTLRAAWVREDLKADLMQQSVHAVVTAASLGVMLVSPALMLPCLALLTLEPVVATYALRRIKASNLSTLEASLRAIDLVPEVALCPSTRPQSYALLQGLKDLKREQASLAAREEVLKRREEAVSATLKAVAAGKEVLAVNDEALILPLQAANEDELLQDNSQSMQVY